MNPGDIEQILEQVATGAITPRKGVAHLVAGGFVEGDAEETVLFARGGSDIVEIGEDGRERYHGSGRLVSEVEAEMAK